MRETHERPVCHRAEDLVSYLYGEAGPADALDFRSHLQKCDACGSEFAAFTQVHSSIQDWRREALGASFNPAAVAEPAIQFVRHERKLSALAALREFFSVSPLWLRGATAFAALLLCVLVVMMVARVPRKPEVAKVDDQQKRYSEQEVQVKVNQAVEAVEQKVRELTASQNPASTAIAPKAKPAGRPNQVQLAVNRQPKNGHPRALNRQEREQLAADLRLTLPADEEDLFLALPDQEHPNQ
jgi:hypothetical protein